jgi:hypothetical protein
MIIAFYELLPGKSRPEKQALNVHPHLEAPLPSIGDLVCFEGIGATEVPGCRPTSFAAQCAPWSIR